MRNEVAFDTLGSVCNLALPSGSGRKIRWRVIASNATAAFEQDTEEKE
jgi:hypothetical protein